MMGMMAIAQLLVDLHGDDPSTRDSRMESLFANIADCLRGVDEWGDFSSGEGVLVVNMDLFLALCTRYDFIMQPARRLREEVR